MPKDSPARYYKDMIQKSSVKGITIFPKKSNNKKQEYSCKR